MPKASPYVWIAALLTLALAGCSSIPSASDRTQHAQRLAIDAGWSWGRIDAGHFTLAYAMPASNPTPSQITTLTVYIEGDGLAWVSSRRPSLDPTPNNPLALRLALKDGSGLVAYLGRPCQYMAREAEKPTPRSTPSAGSECAQRDWTSARFSAQVIDSTNLALDQLIERITSDIAKPLRLHLVGYSGGAAVALLVAARRSDVGQITTIAGNLDHAQWTEKLRLTPMTHSLNPADFGAKLRAIPQVHWVGGRDEVVPPWVAESYEKKTGVAGSVRLMPGFDHQCCWVDHWPLR